MHAYDFSLPNFVITIVMCQTEYEMGFLLLRSRRPFQVLISTRMKMMRIEHAMAIPLNSCVPFYYYIRLCIWVHESPLTHVHATDMVQMKRSVSTANLQNRSNRHIILGGNCSDHD